MSDNTVCGFCHERVKYKNVESFATVEHSCETIKSLKKKFNEALSEIQRDVNSQLKQQLEFITQLQKEFVSLKVHDAIGNLERHTKNNIDEVKARIEKLEKKPGIVDRRIIMSRPESPVVALPKDQTLYGEAQHHPSRQHLEKTLCEKNKTIDRLSEEVGKLNAANKEIIAENKQVHKNAEHWFGQAKRYKAQWESDHRLLNELKRINAELHRSYHCRKVCCLPSRPSTSPSDATFEPSDALAGCYPFAESKL